MTDKQLTAQVHELCLISDGHQESLVASTEFEKAHEHYLRTISNLYDAEMLIKEKHKKNVKRYEKAIVENKDDL